MLAVMKPSLEGVVSKRRSAPYASGSRQSQVKSPHVAAGQQGCWEQMRE